MLEVCKEVSGLNEETKNELNQESVDSVNTEKVDGADAAGAAEANATAETAEATNELERELAELRKTADENYQRLLRAQADFDNFRRRTRQEKEEFAKYASQKLIESLLPVVDNFERAVSASREQKDYDSLVRGLDMIIRQLYQVFEAEGVQPIDAVGKPFNPELHQAVMQAPAEDGVESGIVLEELQKGYILKDRVIRPSMVKVSG
jgi:molecular chaperone GrpE